MLVQPTKTGHRVFATAFTYESRTQVTISGGSSAGVKRGMKFHVLDSSKSDQVVVQRVGPRESSGVIVRWVEEDPRKRFTQWSDYPRYPAIKVGWRLTTSIYKYLDERKEEESTADLNTR